MTKIINKTRQARATAATATAATATPAATPAPMYSLLDTIPTRAGVKSHGKSGDISPIEYKTKFVSTEAAQAYYKAALVGAVSRSRFISGLRLAAPLSDGEAVQCLKLAGYVPKKLEGRKVNEADLVAGLWATVTSHNPSGQSWYGGKITESGGKVGYIRKV